MLLNSCNLIRSVAATTNRNDLPFQATVSAHDAKATARLYLVQILVMQGIFCGT